MAPDLGAAALGVGAGLVVAAYLIGAIPFGVLIARTRGVDIQKEGSGNVGATNVWRVLGAGPGMLCLLLDIGKGFVPVAFVQEGMTHHQAPWLAAAVAIAVVLGHSRSVFLGFAGGKSVATGAGALLALSPVAGLGAIATFALVLAATRYVSLGSVLAAVSLPVWMLLLHEPAAHLVFGVAVAIYIPWRHRGNLARLRSGTEPRFSGRRSRGGAKSGSPPDGRSPA